jgi:aldose 1-epimerase
LSCAGFPALGQATSDYAELDRTNFQKEIDGKPVDLYTIRNNENMVVKITNYGAKIEQIRGVRTRMHDGVGGVEP